MGIHVKALRLYTREQATLEAAIEHQIVLVQIKQALTTRIAGKEQLWDGHNDAFQVCQAVLQENGTSEAELGLRAWVHIRAPRWLGSRCRIGSMATDLASALAVHSRLLHAKATSWEALRAEWVHLVQIRKHVSLMEAEATVDSYRHATLRENLTRALLGVERIQAKQKVEKATAKRTRMARAQRST